jgi:transcription elongation factor SPT5
MHELEVLPKDVQLCSDMATGVDSQGQFQWGDCVQIEYVLPILFINLHYTVYTQLSMLLKRKNITTNKKTWMIQVSCLIRRP